MKISQRVLLLSGHEIMTDGQTYRRTEKLITIGPPPTSSGGALMSNQNNIETLEQKKSNH